MNKKLCDLKKTMCFFPKIGDTPLLYIKEKIVPEFGEKTHNIIRVSKKRKFNLDFLFSFIYS